MINLFKGVFYILICYTLIWIQTFGPSKIDFIKNNKWIIYIFAIPITYLFSEGIVFLLQHFKENSWSVRLISFSINMTVFSFMTYFITGETFNIKNIICLALAIIIVMIQIFWKI